MGPVNGHLILKNPRLLELEPVPVVALVNTGAIHLSIPEHVHIQLKLEAIDQKEVTLADGSRKLVPYVASSRTGPASRVPWHGRSGADERHPHGDMDLVVIPKTRTMDVNPASPNIASSSALGVLS